MKESVFWNPYELDYLNVWAGKTAVEGTPFEEESTMNGISGTVQYIPETKTLF